MPDPSSAAKPVTPAAPPVKWSVVVEATDYANGKGVVKTLITDPNDEYLTKMQGIGWLGYAFVKKNDAVVRSMHVSAVQARELFAMVDAGQEPTV